MDKYHIEILKNKPTKPGCWDCQEIGIFYGDKQIGSYERDYPSLAKSTFFPFKQKDKWYALFSSNYTMTSVMELPSCKILASDKPNFCPAEYYVPYSQNKGAGAFGFVAGCVWGDDTSWKVQFLDLSKITEGVLKRDSRFGYLEIPDIPLKNAINLTNYPDQIKITTIKHTETIDVLTTKRFNIDGKEF
jgi:hypothetical protein